MSDYRRPVNQHGDAFVPDLSETLQEHARKLDMLTATKKVTFTASIGTVETRVRHALGRMPKHISIVPHADARVWMKGKNAQALMLQASAAVEATITLEG